jgi:hypothetical protein
VQGRWRKEKEKEQENLTLLTIVRSVRFSKGGEKEDGFELNQS